MKKYLYILIFIISSLFSDFYSLTPKPLVQYKTHLAISINPNCNSQYVNYAIITESNGRIIKTRFISGSEFIRIGMGKQPSKANNTGKICSRNLRLKIACTNTILHNV